MTGETSGLQLTEKNNTPYFYLPLWEESKVCGHGFSTRFIEAGGEKRRPFDMGFKSGRKPETILENRRRFFSVWDRDPQDFFCGDQVHSDKIALVGSREIDAELRIFPMTDALITADKRAVLGALCADCLLIFFLEPEIPVAAIAHAGWRGTCKGIAWQVVEIMKKKFAANPDRIQALFSPSIAPCCYEVGTEVIESCKHSAWSREMVLHESGRLGHSYFDLQASNRNILIQAGLKTANIFDNNLCTKCDHNMFFSYRGAGGNFSGSHLGIIFLRDMR